VFEIKRKEKMNKALDIVPENIKKKCSDTLNYQVSSSTGWVKSIGKASIK